MAKTGERYAAARAALLAAEESKSIETPRLAVSDEVIRRRTGRGWEEWFDLLDESGAIAKAHREIARWLQSEHGIDGWSAQSVTVSYERARGRRAVGEHADGFAITASKTVAVPVDRLYDARSSASRCASAGCPAAAFASAPRRSRGRPASTGATARRESSSASRPKATPRASSPSSTPRSPAARRPRGEGVSGASGSRR